MIQHSPTGERASLAARLTDAREVFDSLSIYVSEGSLAALEIEQSQASIDAALSFLASQAAQPAEADGVEAIPADIAEHVRKIGRVEWGQTPAHDAEGHGRHVADSVRMTAAHFGQTEDQHMHGLWLEGTETVLCHTGTSPNAPMTTRALVGAWNWLVDQSEAAATPKAPATDAGEKVWRLARFMGEQTERETIVEWLKSVGDSKPHGTDWRTYYEIAEAIEEGRHEAATPTPTQEVSADDMVSRDSERALLSGHDGDLGKDDRGSDRGLALATPPAPNDDLRAALREARTTLSITRTNIMCEMQKGEGTAYRFEGVPEELKKRIDAIDAALKENRRG